MEPPGKRKTLSAICEYLQIKAVSSRETCSASDEDNSANPLFEISSSQLPQTLTETLKSGDNVNSRRRKPQVSNPVKAVKRLIKDGERHGTETTEIYTDFVIDNETGTKYRLEEILGESFEELDSTEKDLHTCEIEDKGSVSELTAVERKSSLNNTPGNNLTVKRVIKRKKRSEKVKKQKKSRTSEDKGVGDILFSYNTDPDADIGPGVTEDLCPGRKCLYNAFHDIYVDTVEKGHQVMKRTPFMACKLCSSPYLNTGALLQHLSKMHSLSLNKYQGIHLCIANAAQYFRESNIRSSELPMEFRGTCWLHSCEYGCSSSTDANELQTLKPVACKGCRQPYGSVAGVLQHIEREHDLYLLRHYLHICPDIYRKTNRGEMEVRGTSVMAENDTSSVVGEMVQQKMDDIDTKGTFNCNNVYSRMEGQNCYSRTSQIVLEMVQQDVDEIDTKVSVVKQEEITSPEKRTADVAFQVDTDAKSSSTGINMVTTRSHMTQTSKPDRQDLSIPVLRENQSCLDSKQECLYGCTAKEKLLRRVRMAYILACKQCCVAFYSISSVQSHCESAHAQDRHRIHKYLHICVPSIVEFFNSVKQRAEKEEILFFRRWYFYDNCCGNKCEFGCSLDHPFTCKVCQDTYSLVEDAVKHIEEQHDTVSIKPLLHICPSMLGDPPILPMGGAMKHKAITHHSYVLLNTNSKKFATPITPILRRGRKIGSASEGGSSLSGAENPGDHTEVKVSFSDLNSKTIGGIVGQGVIIGSSEFTDSRIIDGSNLHMKIKTDSIGSEEEGGAYAKMIDRSDLHVGAAVDSKEQSETCDEMSDKLNLHEEIEQFHGLPQTIKCEPNTDDYMFAEQFNTLDKTEKDYTNESSFNLENVLGLVNSIKSEPQFEFSEMKEQS